MQLPLWMTRAMAVTTIRDRPEGSDQVGIGAEINGGSNSLGHCEQVAYASKRDLSGGVKSHSVRLLGGPDPGLIADRLDVGKAAHGVHLDESLFRGWAAAGMPVSSRWVRPVVATGSAGWRLFSLDFGCWGSINVISACHGTTTSISERSFAHLVCFLVVVTALFECLSCLPPISPVLPAISSHCHADGLDFPGPLRRLCRCSWQTVTRVLLTVVGVFTVRW